MNRLMITQPVNCKTDMSPFLLGISRIFDFTQVINRPGNKSNSEIDNEALKNDWIAIGMDMWQSIESGSEA